MNKNNNNNNFPMTFRCRIKEIVNCPIIQDELTIIRNSVMQLIAFIEGDLMSLVLLNGLIG